jgi:hypothetical protein
MNSVVAFKFYAEVFTLRSFFLSSARGIILNSLVLHGLRKIKRNVNTSARNSNAIALYINSSVSLNSRYYWPLLDRFSFH